MDTVKFLSFVSFFLFHKLTISESGLKAAATKF